MKKWIGISMTTVIISLSFGLQKPNACQSEYYKMDKNECAKYIELSQEAISENNYYEATLYAKRAIREDSWNKKAWVNYNNVIVKITGGNINLIPHTKNFIENNGN